MDQISAEYIIDGVKMELTPEAMLNAAMGADAPRANGNATEPILDESIDPEHTSIRLGERNLGSLLEKVQPLVHKHKSVPAYCAGEFSRSAVAKALIDAIWRSGHFKLEDTAVSAEWNWNFSKVGNCAAFYRSVEAACDYLDNLGVRLKGYDITDNPDECLIKFMACVDRNSRSQMGESRKCPKKVRGKASNWLIYIPFDSSEFSLGGSLLANTLSASGGMPPQVEDADYFMDCYEVVREFVEDGVALSGVTVSRGGLIAGLSEMCDKGKGISANIHDLKQAYGETDSVKVLFSEIPGVILEISDEDYDYIDAEMLLQDIAYYPLGHPNDNTLQITDTAESNISGILQSLLDGQASEGED